MIAFFTKQQYQRAFSLIELLTVVAVAAVLTGLAISAFGGNAEAYRITTTAQGVADAFSLARETAVAKNSLTEVRIYGLPDFGADSGTDVYRAVQVFSVKNGNATPVSKPFMFPQGIVANPNAPQSSLFSLPSQSSTTPISGYQTSRYISVMFGADGTIRGNSSLGTQDEWYLTIQPQKFLNTTGGWPDNYATVILNPFTPKVSIYQPR